MEYLKAKPVGAVAVQEFEAACGVGVKISPEEVEECVSIAWYIPVICESANGLRNRKHFLCFHTVIIDTSWGVEIEVKLCEIIPTLSPLWHQRWGHI